MVDSFKEAPNQSLMFSAQEQCVEIHWFCIQPQYFGNNVVDCTNVDRNTVAQTTDTNTEVTCSSPTSYWVSKLRLPPQPPLLVFRRPACPTTHIVRIWASGRGLVSLTPAHHCSAGWWHENRSELPSIERCVTFKVHAGSTIIAVVCLVSEESHFQTYIRQKVSFLNLEQLKNKWKERMETWEHLWQSHNSVMILLGFPKLASFLPLF